METDAISRDKMKEWKRALRKFENFRKLHKHSIDSLFDLLNGRGTASMSKIEFIGNITRIIPELSKCEAESLADVLDNKHNGMVSISQLHHLINNFIEIDCSNDILAGHSIFPNVT